MDEVILVVSGPPSYTPVHLSSDEYSLRWVLALYLWTRAWQKDQQAKELDDTADKFQMHALLAGAKAPQAAKFVEGYRAKAKELRQYGDKIRIDHFAHLTEEDMEFLKPRGRE